MVYTKIILDTRHKSITGIYSVKIRVTSNKIQKYYLTGYKMNLGDFAETMKDVPHKKFRDQFSLFIIEGYFHYDNKMTK